MPVRIAGEFWTFKLIRGRQYWNGVRFLAMTDAYKREVTITDLLDEEGRMEAAAMIAEAIVGNGPGWLGIAADASAYEPLRRSG